MKKTAAILLAFVMLICLCACGQDEPAGTNGGQNQPTGTTAPQATQCAHKYTEVVTKEATCSEEGIKTFTCDNCKDTYTEAIEKLAHTFANATCTTPKTCTVCNATEGEAAGHTFADATCDAPKTCTVCAATEGEALGHSYVQGKCSRCGADQPGYKALTSCGWTTAGETPDGEELDVITLWISSEDSSIGAGFYSPIDRLDKDLQDELLKYPEDLYDFNGKKYQSKGFGDMRPASYTEQGDTVVISVLEEDVIGTITMVRTAADQYTVTAFTGRIIDDTITSCLHVGSVFTAK